VGVGCGCGGWLGVFLGGCVWRGVGCLFFLVGGGVLGGGCGVWGLVFVWLGGGGVWVRVGDFVGGCWVGWLLGWGE